MMEKLRQNDISMNQGPWPWSFFFNMKSHQISLLQMSFQELLCNFQDPNCVLAATVIKNGSGGSLASLRFHFHESGHLTSAQHVCEREVP